jgi:hypothetical protein
MTDIHLTVLPFIAHRTSVINNSVKASDKTCEAFSYLQPCFQKWDDGKLKENIFVGLKIRMHCVTMIWNSNLTIFNYLYHINWSLYFMSCFLGIEDRDNCKEMAEVLVDIETCKPDFPQDSLFTFISGHVSWQLELHCQSAMWNVAYIKEDGIQLGRMIIVGFSKGRRNRSLQKETEVKKVKLSVCLTNKALRHESIWRSGCIDPRYLDLGTKWRWVVTFTIQPLYPRVPIG